MNETGRAPVVPPGPEGLTTHGYWDDVWQGKDARLQSDLHWVKRQYSWYAFDRLLRARLGPGAGARFLEVGCGGGKWLVYFHKTFGYSVSGCDYSEAGCATTRRVLEHAGIDGTILQQDFFGLTGDYDVVFSAGLIEHFTAPRTVLEKFVSLLNPSRGALITLIPNLAGLSGLYHRRLKPETFETHRIITTDELSRWYADVGLRNIDVGALGSVVPVRVPRDKIRRTHPRLYRLLWGLGLGPATWSANRLCILLARRGIRFESPRYSPYLYAIGEK